MKVLVLPLFVCFFSFAYAGIFNFGMGRDVDIFIRETENSRCRWYNSGILSWIPRRVNETTYCRCSGVRMEECKTYVARARTTTDRPNVSSNTTASTVFASSSSSTSTPAAPAAAATTLKP